MARPATFSRENFDKICDFCRVGNRLGLESFIDGLVRLTNHNSLQYPLCPDPCRHVSSPLVLAAQYGHLSLVVHLVDKYKDVIDINKGATIISHTTKKMVHHATPLWAACTGGHLEIVEFLISRGANVNQTTLTRSTPLRGASFHGYIRIMECLLAHGANVNTPNCIGQSPLCIAAMRGEAKAVEFLLERGADRMQSTINGYNVMHLAAAKGKSDVILLLLQYGVSPMFQPANPFASNYVPCPLFLAASTGQHKAVDVLLKRSDCPVECKADAHLLLSAMQCELRKRLRISEPKIQEYWEKGLRLRQEHSLPIVKMPLVESYQFNEEITTYDELSDIWHTHSFSHLAAFYQSLLIRERCMGFLDQGLIYFLIRRGSYFCQDGCCREAELLWKRAMDMEILVCEIEINHECYGHCEGIMRDLEKDLTMYSHGINQMLDIGFMPDFSMYVNYGLKELEILTSLEGKADVEVVTNHIIIGLVLELFLHWIIHYTSLLKGVDSSDYCWPDECEQLGKLFVSKYLFFKPGTTLLHHVVTNFPTAEDNEKRILDNFTDLRPLVNAIIAWGADTVLDKPNGCGLRPIHLAVQLENQNDNTEILTSLIEAGAHIDAVDKDGNSVYDMCITTTYSNNNILNMVGPSSLFCLSARSIIIHDINYESLPRHVQQFVHYHDAKFVNFL